MPALLCPRHAGTTDIDVHIDLEVQTNMHDDLRRLEAALVASDFVPDKERVWRWKAPTISGPQAEIRCEILTDSNTQPANVTIRFDSCDNLGAANLRGTRYAGLDHEPIILTAQVGGLEREQAINVAGLCGFLLAKMAAAHGRQKPKDWYDIAYVLLHNHVGRPSAVARAVAEKFPRVLDTEAGTWIRELDANFADNDSQGCDAYATQVSKDLPEEDPIALRSDARLAVREFAGYLLTS